MGEMAVKMATIKGQTINKCERLSLLVLNTFNGVNPMLT